MTPASRVPSPDLQAIPVLEDGRHRLCAAAACNSRNPGGTLHLPRPGPRPLAFLGAHTGHGPPTTPLGLVGNSRLWCQHP